MDFFDNRPIFLQVSDGIIGEILKGKLKCGDKLPSIRDLAKVYKVNPNTISKSLAELESTGLFETRRGLGTFLIEDENKIKNAMDDYIDEKIMGTIEDYRALGLTPDRLWRLIKERADGNYTENK